jgi:hypothetical protein
LGSWDNLDIKANMGITCVCFIGHGRLSDTNQVIESAEYIKAEYKVTSS